MIVPATITSGQTVGNACDLRPNVEGLPVLVGLDMPAAFTGTTITFQVSTEGTTYKAFYDDAGAVISVTVAASRYVRLIPALFAGIRHLKLVSGSAEGADRTVQLVFAKAS